MMRFAAKRFGARGATATPDMDCRAVAEEEAESTLIEMIKHADRFLSSAAGEETRGVSNSVY